MDHIRRPIVIIATVLGLLSAPSPRAEAATMQPPVGGIACHSAITSGGSSDLETRQTGLHSSETNPLRMQTYNAFEWSDAAQIDLTNETAIPLDAVVRQVRISYEHSTGGYSLPHVAIFDEDGRCFYVNRYSRLTSALAGLPVRQRWHVRFWTEHVRTGPARLWPRMTITYE